VVALCNNGPANQQQSIRHPQHLYRTVNIPILHVFGNGMIDRKSDSNAKTIVTIIRKAQQSFNAVKTFYDYPAESENQNSKTGSSAKKKRREI
jgi:hypothetical protein